MSGLQGILAAISSDAEIAVNKIHEEAKSEIETILKNAEITSNKECLSLKACAEDKAEAKLSAAHSTAEMLKKKAVLKAKNELISEVVEEARLKIINQPTEQYFDFLLGILKRHAKNTPCKILFCERDYQRLPNSFLNGFDHITAAISPEISEGFVLQYGNIEENCTIEALIEAHIDEVRDIAHDRLFNVG